MSTDEASQPSSDKDESLRAEDILLQRLQAAQGIKPQVQPVVTALILAVIIAIGFILYLSFDKPDVFAEIEKQADPHALQTDQAELNAKRLRFQKEIDSLLMIRETNPDDEEVLLHLANRYYDIEDWGRSMPLYGAYLQIHPENVDARVDFAFTVAQATGDYTRAIEEIEKGLKYDPKHVHALFNAGILSLRANMTNKDLALKTAGAYFIRAKSIAEVSNPEMAAQIDEILAEIEKVERETK